MTTTATRTPAVGELAPDFTLASTANQQVTLSNFRGDRAVLLAFFPLAFTSTCTSELCAFTDDFDVFGDTGVQILPISVDATASLKEYRNKYNMKTELLSDFRRDVSRAYGVLNEEKFYSQRAYFLIDKQGIVRWVHVEDKNGMHRSNSEILEQIRSLK